MRNIWIIGAGSIAKEYAKVLKALNVEYIVIGRGDGSASRFELETGHAVIRGGLRKFIENSPQIPDNATAIVAVDIESLTETCIDLLQYGIKNILLEKPGIGRINEIYSLADTILKKSANVLLAYNRRFYSSVLKTEELIREDGGVSSFNFEFTEWSHTIASLKKTKVEHQNWFMGNSSHVIDTAFFLGGFPRQISAFRAGENKQLWHPSGSIYAGAGISEKDALFTYQANWNAPGRWAVEILTEKHRFYLKPMEMLQVQNIGSVAINPIEIDHYLDMEFKPGFYLQVKAFLEKDYSRFCSIEEQLKHIDSFYKLMSGYE